MLEKVNIEKKNAMYLKTNPPQIVLLVYYLPVFARLSGTAVQHLPAVHNRQVEGA